MIQGVIFDMDGLMFDTERIWATLWEPALAGLGLSYKEGLDEAARGTAGDSMRAVLRRFYGPDCDPDRIIEALHKQGETAFLAPPPKKPGLDEILAWLEQRHIPMVVASSSRMASIRHHLDGWGLTHYFKAVISGEQFTSSKPDPEIFYRAAEMLGTAPEHTLVLEDSYNGVRAGAAGGFVTVMVPDLAQPVHRRVRQPARGAPDAGKRPAVRVSSSTTAGTMPRRTRLVTNRFSTPASFPRRVMVRLRVPPTDTMPQL